MTTTTPLNLRATAVDPAALGGEDILGSSLLHTYVQKNKGISRLTRALRQASTPDPRNLRGETPLHLAAECGHAAAVVALLKAGADPAARTAAGKSPLDLALRGGKRWLVGYDGTRCTTTWCTDFDRTNGHVVAWGLLHQAFSGPLGGQLSVALDDRHEVACRWLLEQGADPNAPNEGGARPLSLLLDQLEWSSPPPDEVVAQLESQMILLLLEAGADPHLPLKTNTNDTAAQSPFWPLLENAWHEQRLERALPHPENRPRHRL